MKCGLYMKKLDKEELKDLLIWPTSHYNNKHYENKTFYFWNNIHRLIVHNKTRNMD